MANLPETPAYSAGVYQLEVVDPVLGGATGISNTQAQQLGNRTAYLKQHMDAAEGNISSLTTAVGNKANIASPTFTGTPAAPTAADGTNTTQIATTAFVTTAISNINLSIYAPLASPSLTGTPTAPTASPGTSTTQIATTAFVTAADSTLNTNLTTAIGLKANSASPALTGVPTAPTAAALTNTTQIATTAFVTAADTALSGTLTTSIAGKLSKTGDTGTGNYGINAAAASGNGLRVSGVDVDNDWALRVLGDMSVQAAPTAAVDQAILYFKKKDGTTQFAIAQDPSQVGGLRFYNSSLANVALIADNGSFIGSNIDVSGTWVPTVIGETSAGSCTYTNRIGEYAIVGNLIYWSLVVDWTGHTGTGTLSVTGLPAASVGAVTYPGQIIMQSGVTANTVYATRVSGSESKVRLFSRVVTGTLGDAPVVVFASGGFRASGWYRYR